MKKFIGTFLGILAFGILSVATIPKANAQQPPLGIKTYLRVAPIVVTFEQTRWVATSADIRNWVSLGKDGRTIESVDPSSFVQKISDQVNVSPTSNQDGRSVDTGNLNNQINEIFSRGQPNQTIALVTSVVPRGGNRHVEINLSEQTLYAWEGSNLVNQFLISSGKRGYETPTGDFNVYGKTDLQKMSGPGYYLPDVPWISWFYGDYSIHGTYWHHNFGHPMSHGCINASIPDAEWVYNWDNIGTPVNVHY